MKIVKVWNIISDIILDVLRVATVLLILTFIILMIINLITGVDEDLIRYSVALAVLVYLNNKLNGG